MSEHTPGPWRIADEKEDPDYFDIESAADTQLPHIGHVHNWTMADIANARLIAAAPDLLEALRELEAWCLDDSGDLDEVNRRGVLYIAQAAIARAKGEE